MTGEIHNDAVRQALTARDPDAFAGIYRHYFPLLFSIARKYLPDGSTAEEIIQDVFLHIWETAPVLEYDAALKNYLCRAVVNRCLNHLKRNEMLRRHHAEIFSSSEDSYVSTFVEEQELRLCIHEAIEKLPPKCREVFRLSRFEGLKNPEIAAQLGISVKTVENQMTIALKLLRTHIFHPSSPFSSKSRTRMWLFFVG
ncbi:RNA polymerase sigma-70 factor [Chitinophaga sp.]|uniref:RNA polymerase sigma-70 factor n=1 Tax=Chitinophaga sp. TaxID=1869181 RepID=UPI00262257DF|nr:RNA polymerase sigma-70 factor [uncultured Chitinophaga sp.]